MANSECKPTKNGWLKNLLFNMKNKNSKKQVNSNCPCTNAQSTKNDQPPQTALSADNKKKYVQKRGIYFGKSTANQKGCGGLHIYFCINSDRKVKNSRCKRIRKEKTDKGHTSTIETRSEKSLPWSISARSQSPKNIKNTTHNNLTSREVIGETFSSPADKPSNYSFKNKEDSTNVGGSILRIKHSTPVSNGPTAESNVAPKTSVHPSTQEKISHRLETEKIKNEAHKTNGGSEVDEEAVFREYETLQQQNRLKRKSMKSNRATIVRNSLISLRKKRQSFAENLIPEIFSKLDEIEDKLSSLEKVYETKGKNITNIVGISCKSMGSLDLANLEKVDEKDKRTPSVLSISDNTYQIHPLLIKPVVKKTSVNKGSLSAVKNMKSELGSSKHLVYCNTLLLDAHNISSKSIRKSGTADISFQKTAVWLGSHREDLAKKQMSTSWRRISEELKL